MENGEPERMEVGLAHQERQEEQQPENNVQLINEELQRLNARRLYKRMLRFEVFEKRMRRFHYYSLLTNLDISDCRWSGELKPLDWPQKVPLCGYQYGRRAPPEIDMQDTHWRNTDTFTPTCFLRTTYCVLYTAGTAHKYDNQTALFVFERAMKMMNQYLNFMYDLALHRGRKMITSEDLEALLSRDLFRQYLYHRHFYPVEIEIEAPAFGFHNEFTRRIHNLIQTDPIAKQRYRDYANQNLAIEAARPTIVAHFTNNFWTNWNPVEFRQTFIRSDVDVNCLFSTFAANRFYEALGMPPLETDLITAIEWLFRQCIHAIARKTLLRWEQLGHHDQPSLECYQLATVNPPHDLLFDFDFELSDSNGPMVIPNQPAPLIFWNTKPRKTPFTDLEPYYIKKRMLDAVEKYRVDFYEKHHVVRSKQEMYIRNHEIMSVYRCRKP